MTLTPERLDQIERCESAMNMLVSEQRELVACARRYQWLRKQHASDNPSFHVRKESGCPVKRDLDEAIDAAMKASSHE